MLCILKSFVIIALAVKMDAEKYLKSVYYTASRGSFGDKACLKEAVFKDKGKRQRIC